MNLKGVFENCLVEIPLHLRNQVINDLHMVIAQEIYVKIAICLQRTGDLLFKETACVSLRKYVHHYDSIECRPSSSRSQYGD